MHKGDVLHTSRNTPHQMTVPAGKTFVYQWVMSSIMKRLWTFR